MRRPFFLCRVASVRAGKAPIGSGVGLLGLPHRFLAGSEIAQVKAVCRGRHVDAAVGVDLVVSISLLVFVHIVISHF